MTKKTKTTKRRELTEREKDCAALAKHAYKKSGLSQAEIGEKLGGISQSAVGQYLNGVVPMNLPIQIAFCLALEIPLKKMIPDFPINVDLSEDEEMLVNAYRKSDDEGKALTLGVAERAGEYDQK